jgi:site-specific DNA-adenine methylase
VQIENQDWRSCLRDYDGPNTVFYLDPPYVDAFVGTYKHELSQADHRELLSSVFELKGTVCMSGYTNPLYEEQDWDERYEIEVMQSIRGCGETDGNNPNPRKHLKGQRGMVTEVLWIKR